MPKDFIPHPQCDVMNGDCFRESQCLRGCRSKPHADRDEPTTMRKRLDELEKQVEQLRSKN